MATHRRSVSSTYKAKWQALTRSRGVPADMSVQVNLEGVSVHAEEANEAAIRVASARGILSSSLIRMRSDLHELNDTSPVKFTLPDIDDEGLVGDTTTCMLEASRIVDLVREQCGLLVAAYDEATSTPRIGFEGIEELRRIQALSKKTTELLGAYRSRGPPGAAVVPLSPIPEGEFVRARVEAIEPLSPRRRPQPAPRVSSPSPGGRRSRIPVQMSQVEGGTSQDHRRADQDIIASAETVATCVRQPRSRRRSPILRDSEFESRLRRGLGPVEGEIQWAILRRHLLDSRQLAASHIDGNLEDTVDAAIERERHAGRSESVVARIRRRLSLGET